MDEDYLRLFIDSFYEITQTPLFLLDQHKVIKYQSNSFPLLPSDFFCAILYELSDKQLFHFYFLKQEVYINFQVSNNNHNIAYVCIGPFLLYKIKNDPSLMKFYIFQTAKFDVPHTILHRLPMLDEKIYPYIQHIYVTLYKECLSKEQIYESLFKPHTLTYKKQLLDLMYENREDTQSTYSYEDEVRLLNAIRKGNSISARIIAMKIASGKIGNMSQDRMRKSKYAVIASITLFTRATIESGVSVERAYAMSDIYIQRIDEEYDPLHLIQHYMNAIIDFCDLVKHNIHQEHPQWVRKCMEYINQNLHEEITLANVAEHVHMAPAYISVQFKKIYGGSMKQYIQEQRIEEAKFLLKTTSMSIHEIALTLNFSSQSYFTKVFKEVTNELPHRYRTKYE